MNDLIIAPSEKTPGVDLSQGILFFHGRSIINNTKSFFEPIFAWVRHYLKNPAELTAVTIKLEYIDSPSLQALFQLLQQLKELGQNGHVLLVNWYYIYGDLEMLELGHMVQERLEIEFDFYEFQPEHID
ncbi:MAG: SiaC family regulatory phosphoprotein [Bacteroidales bacterium]|nr:SiaC family regulatory phosphoprotein [Bacteroidales bacterium]